MAMKLKCPRCGNLLETGNAAAGTPLHCSCGNVLAAPKPTGKFPVWLAVVLAGFFGCIPCTGILAAIAVPNFIRFQSRAKQSECKANLKAFYVAAKSAQLQDHATTDMAKLGWSPERGNRYAYFTSFTGPVKVPGDSTEGDYEGVLVDTARYPNDGITAEAAAQAAADVQPGLSGNCPGEGCALTVVCVGNIDSDDTYDVWSISTGDRELTTGTVVRAGEPMHNVDDLVQ